MSQLYRPLPPTILKFFTRKSFLICSGYASIGLILAFLGLITVPLTAQIGMNAHYVYGPKKEAFGGRISYGKRDVFRIGAGYEQGKFNSLPTQRVLDYYSVRLGGDVSIFSKVMEENDSFFSFFDPYIGVDVEYLQPTRIIEDYRVSVFPRFGMRFFNAIFIEGLAEDLNQPSPEGRFFKFKINSYRILIGFECIFGKGK